MSEQSVVYDDDDGPSDLSGILDVKVLSPADVSKGQPTVDMHQFAEFQRWQAERAAASLAGNAGPGVASMPDQASAPMGDGQLHPNTHTGVAQIKPVGIRKLVRIICEETDNMPPTGYPIGINGRCYIIQPGEEVDVPEEVIEVLMNAVESKPIFDPQSRRVTGHRDRLRIPFRRVSRAAY